MKYTELGTTRLNVSALGIGIKYYSAKEVHNVISINGDEANVKVQNLVDARIGEVEIPGVAANDATKKTQLAVGDSEVSRF